MTLCPNSCTTTPFGSCTHLRKICDLHVPLCLDDFATVRLQPAHNYLQLRCLSGAVHTCTTRPGQATADHALRLTIHHVWHTAFNTVGQATQTVQAIITSTQVAAGQHSCGLGDVDLHLSCRNAHALLSLLSLH